MTKPILAYPPLSATTVRAYLTQVGLEYDKGHLLSFGCDYLFSVVVLKLHLVTAWDLLAKNLISTSQNLNIKIVYLIKLILNSKLTEMSG